MPSAFEVVSVPEFGPRSLQNLGFVEMLSSDWDVFRCNSRTCKSLKWSNGLRRIWDASKSKDDFVMFSGSCTL